MIIFILFMFFQIWLGLRVSVTQTPTITWTLEISLYIEKDVRQFSSSLGGEHQHSEKDRQWHVGSLLSSLLSSICLLI